MILKLRKIKRAWAFCDTDHNHGKTEFELTITTNDYFPNNMKVWLCQNCIAGIHNQLDNEATRLWKEFQRI